jgi:hypothetical protein
MKSVACLWLTVVLPTKLVARLQEGLFHTDFYRLHTDIEFQRSPANTRIYKHTDITDLFRSPCKERKIEYSGIAQRIRRMGAEIFYFSYYESGCVGSL